VANAVVDRFIDAWNRRDVTALVATMAPDAFYEVVPQGRLVRPETLRQQLAIVHSLSSDFSVESISVIGDEQRCAIEWELSGTHDGPFGPFRLRASGRHFTIRGVWVMEFDGELVRCCRSYWDLAGLLNQLGTAPGGEVAWQLANWEEERSVGGRSALNDH